MDFKTIYYDDLGATAQITAFTPENKIHEFHIILHIEPRNQLFPDQLSRMLECESRLNDDPTLSGARFVLKRYFLSDAVNQQPLMPHEPNCAVSLIQQPPLDGSKIAVWLYMIRGANVYNNHNTTIIEHNDYKHLWTMGLVEPEGDSAQQTTQILTRYTHTLNQFNATLAQNCIRTWFFVRDVDTQYAGMVTARKDFFAKQGLTQHTHYISSTGIGGTPALTHAIVQMGAYALTGLKPQQQHYLYARTHLNPTYEYGVTFERGTLLRFGDRAHVIISGTASIDNKGHVVYPGNIIKQTQRMWENVEALLKEGGASFDNVMQIVVYLRDIADYNTVKQMFDQKFPHIPAVFTLAPVCRPTWLVEMECVAVIPQLNREFNDF